MVRGIVWQLLRPAAAVTLTVATLLAATPSARGSSLHHSYSAMEKRPYKNFLRFGRGNDAMSAILAPGNPPMALGNPEAVYDNLGETDALDMALADVWAAKRAADRNFLRFGRGFNPKNFIRFGRAGGPRAKNFLRFGRDISSDEIGTGPQQHFVDGPTSHQTDFNSGPATANRITSSDVSEGVNTIQENGRSKRSVASSSLGDADENTRMSLDTKIQGDSNARSKRAVPNLFALLNSPNGIDWLPEDDDMAGFSYGDGSSGEDETLNPSTFRDIEKRGFLRFGREPTDLHFIRFGKRGSGEDGSGSGSMEGGAFGMAGLLGTGNGALGSGNAGINQYDRELRARNNKNFLRFGR